MTESDLFAPVKTLFENQGYTVNAEVKDCDLTAVKDDELIITELKRSLSVHLLAQALTRQKSGAKVYVAVPKPKNYNPKKFRETLYVLKKLELGLIFVTLRGDFSFAETIYDPLPFVPVAENKKKRAAILKEIDGRTLDKNVGGITGKKIVTAFCERNIQIACALDALGEMSPAQVKAATGIEKAASILSMNAYGWFKKVRRGVYAVTEKGRREILDYPELEQYYTQKLLRGADE
ncbi:MAG: DUF2161 family putative PD-(D/E)XK-type phosphodiesterase [Firmicutes bacterium]|nr:DUF2161 family putative PD-(D/E)XK-type phosphodiesterase [Bacillota bacterium]